MNYCVLGMLIEQLTGQRYEEVVYERLLTPLGISGMRIAPTYDPGPGEIEHYTTEGRNYMEALGAAGAWVATAGDIVTILDSLDAQGMQQLYLDVENPLVMVLVTRQMGRGSYFAPFVVVYNWSTILVVGIMAVPQILFAAGFMSFGIAFLLTLIALVIAFSYRWFVARVALDISGGWAAGVVGIDIVVSFLINRMMNVFLGI